MELVFFIVGLVLGLLLLVYVSQIAAATKAAVKEMKAQSELLQKLVWQGQKAHEREERRIQQQFFGREGE